MSYGTVLLARVRPGRDDDLRKAGDRWVAERAPVVRGFEAVWVMIADDGSVVHAVRFASKEDYAALADDPAQEPFWQEHFAPLLEDVRWIDGPWEPPVGSTTPS